MVADHSRLAATHNTPPCGVNEADGSDGMRSMKSLLWNGGVLLNCKRDGGNVPVAKPDSSSWGSAKELLCPALFSL